MFAFQRATSTLAWPFCHVVDGPIRKDVLYGELVSGARRVSHPALRFRAGFKRDICSDRHRILGIYCSRPQQLATGCVQWYEEGRRKQRNELPCLYIKLSTHVPSVTGIATQNSDFLVTSDDVQNTDVTYGASPLSLEID